MKRLLVLVAALLISNVSYGRPWTSEEVALAVTATALHLIDWRQTSAAMASGEYRETNPVMGERPSQAEIDRFMLASLAAFAIAIPLAEPEDRVFILSALVLLKAGAVSINASAGLTVSW